MLVRARLQENFKTAFEETGIIEDVVWHLKSDDMKLRENCALAIFKCASNEKTRTIVRKSGGLDPLCKLVQSTEVTSNKRLLAAVTGSIWKCAISPENVTRFNQNNLVASLVPLLEENENEQVLTNVVGALSECCKDPNNRNILRVRDGLPKLVKIVRSAQHRREARASVCAFPLLSVAAPDFFISIPLSPPFPRRVESHPCMHVHSTRIEQNNRRDDDSS